MACYDNYDQLFRDLGKPDLQQGNHVGVWWYGENATDVRQVMSMVSQLQETSNSEGGMGKGGSQMMAYPTLFFDYDKDDQRRDVSVCKLA